MQTHEQSSRHERPVMCLLISRNQYEIKLNEMWMMLTVIKGLAGQFKQLQDERN